MKFSLDMFNTFQYSDSRAETEAHRIGVLEHTGGRAASNFAAIFTSTCMVAPSMGGPCREPQGSPVPVFRHANLHGSAHHRLASVKRKFKPQYRRPSCLQTTPRTFAPLLARSGHSASPFVLPVTVSTTPRSPVRPATPWAMPCRALTSLCPAAPASNQSTATDSPYFIAYAPTAQGEAHLYPIFPNAKER